MRTTINGLLLVPKCLILAIFIIRILCEQDCGIGSSEELTRTETIPFISYGKIINITEVPWHVAIFGKIGRRSRFIQHCGGTILSNRLIISAAHCFWDEKGSSFRPVSNFRVGVGKSLRAERSLRENRNATLMKVQEIRNFTQFEGAKDNYYGDLVVLVLVNTIPNNVNVCYVGLEEPQTINIDDRPANQDGTMTGWGKGASDNQPSPTLKKIQFPIIRRPRCFEEFGDFLTADKFCAGRMNGQTACMGDDGGGLVFPKVDINGKQKYFLRGLVSHFDYVAEDYCDNPRYNLFTNVLFYMTQIKDMLREFG